MYVTLYLWACCNWGWLLFRSYKEIFWYCVSECWVFSISLEYIFVVNWLRTLILLFVTSHYSFLLDNYYMFFFPRTYVFLFSQHTGVLIFHITHLCCTAKESLTVFECCFGLCMLHWNLKTFTVDSNPIILACLIIFHALIQFLLSSSSSIVLVFVSCSSRAISGEVDKRGISCHTCTAKSFDHPL